MESKLLKLIPILLIIFLIIGPIILWLFKTQDTGFLFVLYNVFDVVYPVLILPNWKESFMEYLPLIFPSVLIFYLSIKTIIVTFKTNHKRILFYVSKFNSFITTGLIVLAMINSFFSEDVLFFLKETIVGRIFYDTLFVLIPFVSTTYIIFVLLNNTTKLFKRSVITD